GQLFAQARLHEARAFTDPLGIGLARLAVVGHVVGVQQTAFLGINHQDLAGADAALGDHIFGIIGVHADLGGRAEVAVLRQDPARRPQAVLVEHADGVTAVRHHHAGGTVPWLHVHGSIGIKAAAVRVHVLHVLAAGWHDQANRLVEIHAAGDQEFQHVVHGGGVGTGEVHHRCDFLDVRYGLGAKLVDSCQGPVAVALYGVDFAIVGQHAEGLCQWPFGESVGGKALVEGTHRNFDFRILEIQIEVGQIGRHHQSFVGKD